MTLDTNSEPEGWRRDRILALEWKAHSLELEHKDLCYALDTETSRREALEMHVRKLTARVRRLEQGATAAEMLKRLWQHLWFRGALVILLASGNVSVERVTQLAKLFTKVQ